MGTTRFSHILVIGLILLALPLFSMAQDSILKGCKEYTPDAEFIAKLEANNRINELQCKFREVKHISDLAQEVIGHGIFRFRDGEMRLEYKQPSGNLIVIGKEKFTVVSNGKKSVIGMEANPMMKQFKGMLGATMGGTIEMFGKESDIKYYTRNSEYDIVIAPSDKRTSRHLQKIVLVFDSNDMTLNELAMYQSETDFTHYTFTGKKITL